MENVQENKAFADRDGVVRKGMKSMSPQRVKRAGFLSALLLLLLLTGAALGETAEDLAAQCEIRSGDQSGSIAHLTDGSLETSWKGRELTVRTPAGKKCRGVMLSFASDPVEMTVLDEAGNRIAFWQDPYYVAWIPFERPTECFTLKGPEGKKWSLFRLAVLTEGELPEWVQQWKDLEGNADLMLVVTHPDDDLLWFGGLLPYYAGERGLKVQMVYMVGGQEPVRRIELLDALWHCHVKDYPVIGDFPDAAMYSRKGTLKRWGGEEALDLFLGEQLNTFRPAVVVTQDLKGEYGHVHHELTVEAVIRVIAESGEDSVWFRPMKLYLHLYGENEIFLNWDRPLASFGGKTGMEVAAEAYRMHTSQQFTHFHVAPKGSKYDSTRYGLYWSRVGEDREKTDFLENTDKKQ